MESKAVTFSPFYGIKFISEPNYYSDKLFVLFQRPATENQLKFFDYFKNNIKQKTRTGMLIELDDDLFDIPKWNMAYDYYNKNRKHCIEMIKKADGVSVSTEFLARKVRKYNKNVVVNLNHLPKFIWGGSEPKIRNIHNKKPRIFWGGSANHFALQNSGLSGGDFGDELINFIKKTTDVYQWVFLGAIPNELYDAKDKIEIHKWKTPLHYPNYLKNLNIDVGIAPLFDHDFNKSKSFIKALEYVAMGIPAVYSDIEPYKDMSYKAKTDDEMISLIEKLVSDPSLRYDVYSSDYKAVESHLFWEENNNIEKYVNNMLSFFNFKL